MSKFLSYLGRGVGNAVDPAHVFYKPGPDGDPNRDAAIAAAQQAEKTATGDAQSRMAQIYGDHLPALQAATGAAADAARLRTDQVSAAADQMAGWRPGVFDASQYAPPDIYTTGGAGAGAMADARAAQVAQQRADLAPVMAGQMGAGPSVAAAQQAAAMDAARRNAGIMAASGHGNPALAARAAMLQNQAPGIAVAGAQARGGELAQLRAQAGQGQANVYGNVLGMDQTAQQQEALRNQVELANRQNLTRQAGLASDAFSQVVRDYKVGGALTKTADLAKMNAFDQGMQDQESAFGTYQDYLRQLYGTGLDTAVKAGDRASGTLSTILGAQRQQDAANLGLASTLIGGVLGGVGKGVAATANANDNGGGG